MLSRNYQKLLGLILTLCWGLALAGPAWAAEVFAEGSRLLVNANKDGSVIIWRKAEYDENNLIQIHGQIVFDDAGLVQQNGSENTEYIDEAELQNVLQPYIEEGKKLKGVGWTKVYVQYDNSEQITPETAEQRHCPLTLYTIVGVDDVDRTEVFADTVALWDDEAGYGKRYNSHTATLDCIGIASPDGCVFKGTYSLTGASKNPFMTSCGDTHVAVCINERDGQTTLMTKFDNVSCAGRQNWVSSYSHTWANILDASFDISFNIQLKPTGWRIGPVITQVKDRAWPHIYSSVCCSL